MNSNFEIKIASGLIYTLLHCAMRKEFDSFLLHFDLSCDTLNIEKGSWNSLPLLVYI